MVKEKLTVQGMAEELGIKKENLELGLKKDKSAMEDAINKAYNFKKSKGKKK